MNRTIVGIDTGGTYTDGVLIDYDTKDIKRSVKTLTTKKDLMLGISACIDDLNIDNENICLVCLSTTLATNSVVENKVDKVGLITIGNPSFVDLSGREYPAYIHKHILGGMDISGREIKSVDVEELRNVLLEMKGKINTLAVSGFASVKNPSQELLVKKYAEIILDVPVICAHELTTSLGYYQRTVTAVMNAKLIPIVWDFIDGVKSALSAKGINAPVTMMKGDGHTVISEYARLFPVETVLSGPAASVAGAKFLSKYNDAIIVDMGGTTTDIACLDNGEVMLESEGMNIEGWETRTKAVKVFTFGLGGDSRIRWDKYGNLIIGPQRAVPLCTAASESKKIYDELRKYRLPSNYVIENFQETDCIRLLNNNSELLSELDDRDKCVLELLEDGAHTLLYLANEIGTDIDSLNIEKLIDYELVQLISLTPTDILHITGEFIQWDSKISEYAAHLLAERKGMDIQEFITFVQDEFIKRVCTNIIKSLCWSDGMVSDLRKDAVLDFILNRMIDRNPKDHFHLNCIIDRPVIGVGAPTGIWLRKVADYLGFECIIPDYASVANAIGAAVGDAKKTIEATIFFDQFTSKYIAYLPKERKVYDSLDEAKVDVRALIRKYAEDIAIKYNLKKSNISMSETDYCIDDICYHNKTFVRTTIITEIEGMHI